MAAAQQAMGWPDHVSTGDSVALASRMSTICYFSLPSATPCRRLTDVIDKVAEACFAFRLI
jgi:hypothetical protein